jgi:hypothetical protein
MSIIISLPPATEESLRQCAAQTGQTVEGFVQRILERVVHRANGGRSPGTASASQGSLPFDEALAAFRQEVAESGITDDELLALFDEMREEAYQHKHGRPSACSMQ